MLIMVTIRKVIDSVLGTCAPGCSTFLYLFKSKSSFQTKTFKNLLIPITDQKSAKLKRRINKRIHDPHNKVKSYLTIFWNQIWIYIPGLFDSNLYILPLGNGNSLIHMDNVSKTMNYTGSSIYIGPLVQFFKFLSPFQKNFKTNDTSIERTNKGQRLYTGSSIYIGPLVQFLKFLSPFQKKFRNKWYINWEHQ